MVYSIDLLKNIDKNNHIVNNCINLSHFHNYATRQKKKKIFVSYTTRDNKLDIYSLRVLEWKLTRLGYSCYIDLLHNNSKNKQQRVFNEIITSDYFIAIISDSYHLSPWTQKEIKLAHKLKKRIIEIDYFKIYDINMYI
ncbi:TPA: toll/interleukin-1 receptor domain-containing protein [Salmonella enterica subsp. salamae serovar 16:m,t:e,n,x]|nr:toll/interleukin-1 receptor domain-containing protein [Salmonella enterica subsp. salamae serovar 16:m,t:e,n,x]HCM1924029.1 toll/interleukin-1 receptor domain-containing protein [Salmonella enterica subsp. salamae serovar 16:m,t:e,n,x]